MSTTVIVTFTEPTELSRGEGGVIKGYYQGLSKGTSSFLNSLSYKQKENIYNHLRDQAVNQVADQISIYMVVFRSDYTASTLKLYAI